MKKWQRLSKEEIAEICRSSNCLTDFAQKLGYKSSVSRCKQIIEFYDLDTSHFHGQGWNKNNYDLSAFKKGVNVKADKRLSVLTFLRGNKCERCGLETWLDGPIPLCTHHIDGDHLNNELENLELLCPNCHALTDNYCGKNVGNQTKYTDDMYVEALRNSQNIHQALVSMGIHYSAKLHYERCYRLIEEYDIQHLK